MIKLNKIVRARIDIAVSYVEGRLDNCIGNMVEGYGSPMDELRDCIEILKFFDDRQVIAADEVQPDAAESPVSRVKVAKNIKAA